MSGTRVVLSVVCFAALSLGAAVGCDDGESTLSPPSQEQPQPTAPSGTDSLTVELPPGWHVVREPLTSITEPRPALAVASFGLHDVKQGRNCTATDALSQMPRGGTLIQVLSWGDVAGRPVRWDTEFPRVVSLRPHELDTYECAGRSYNEVFRRDGLALQASVNFRPDRPSDKQRLEAEAILNRVGTREARFPVRPVPFCLTGGGLQTLGGEMLAALGHEPVPGRRERRLTTITEEAFVPSLGWGIHLLQRKVPPRLRPASERTVRAVRRGIERVRAEPGLLLDEHGLARAFARARLVAEAYGLARHCRY